MCQLFKSNETPLQHAARCGHLLDYQRDQVFEETLHCPPDIKGNAV